MPRWLTARRCVVAGLLSIVTTAHAAAQAVPAIAISLPPAQERWRDTVTSAAQDAATLAREWLGPHPAGTITQIDFNPPLWQGRGAMFVERQVAAAVIRSWWPARVGDQTAGAMLDGFAWHLQGQAIERLFERRYRRAAHSVETIPVFGDTVFWSFPQLRLSRWSSDQPHAADVARFAAIFATLERRLGEPALQGAMAVVAATPPDRLNGSAIVTTLGDATGQDLSWLFAAASDLRVSFDYALTDMTSAPVQGACSDACFETTVTAARIGDGQLTGRSSARVGPFDSGDAIAIKVTFANGEQASARWDGRDSSRTFRFVGSAPATTAVLDPDRVLMLDTNPLNNSIRPSVPTNVPVSKWLARWIVWMQNTVLSYGFFA